MLAWLSGLFSSWLVNPLLFAGGALLVSVPIIIHLLNKRKFRIVDWAAMDFLLEADQQNRRRVQLENLIILLLRCLAVLLIALLVARPYQQLGLGGWLDAARFERIVILDDSPSMGARDGSETSFSKAIGALEKFIEGLATDASDDSLTIILTSAPDRPLVNDEPINGNTAVEVAEALKSLTPSDRSARFDLALTSVGKALEERSDRVNRVVYVISDLRERDWASPSGEEAKSAAAEALAAISGNTAGCFLMDVGTTETDNLGVVGVVPQDKALLAGLPVRYQVTVRNHGSTPASRVPVRFSVGDSLPLRAEIDVIPAGGTAAVPFTHTIVAVGDTQESVPDPVRIEVTIEPSGPSAADLLPADNSRFFAARVARGIDTLIVDGDASASFGQSESFYLQRALAPPGNIPSGVAVKTMTDVEFETENLDKYQTIFLCNVFRLSDPRRKSLESWVHDGGGLVVMPGNQVDDRHYTTELFRGGSGLLPLELISIEGDEAEEKWVSFAVASDDHPVFSVFEGGASPVMETAKVFHWWNASLSQEAVNAGKVNVLARLTDEEQTPAIVEMPLGTGRVVMTTFPADTAWSNWPEEAGYLVTLQELTRYMARRTASFGEVVVGETIRQPIDLAQYSADVTLTDPDGVATSIQPVAAEGADQSQLLAKYERTERRGFYEMTLNRVDGQTENKLFAANLEDGEGQLTRVNVNEVKSTLGDKVQIVGDTALSSLDPEAARGELWKWVLAGLIVVMCVEQFLAWGFAARR